MNLMIDAFISDLRHSWRNILKNKRWTAVAILGLALGIGANVGMLRTVSPLIVKLPVRNPDELVAFRYARGRVTITELNQAQVSTFVFRQLQAANQTLTHVFGFSETVNCSPELTGSACPGNGSLVVSGRGDLARFQYVSGNFFTALGIPAARGRTLVSSDDSLSAPPVAVISNEYWRLRFNGDPSIVGSPAIFNDEPVTIVGILPARVRDPLQPQDTISDILLPLAAPLRAMNRRSQTDVVQEAFNIGVPAMGWLAVMGRLKPGVTLAQVEANLGGVAARASREEWDAFWARLSPEQRLQVPTSRLKGFLNPRRFFSIRVVPGNHGVLDMHPGIVYNVAFLFTISGIFLFIVCMNITNLLMAQAASRNAEISVRAALGAARSRLMRQFMTQSSLLAVLAGVVSLWVAQWPAFLFPVEPDGRPSPLIDSMPAVTSWPVLIVTLGLSLLVGLVSGIGPAWNALSSSAAPALRRVVPFGGSRSVLTRAMLIAQVALSLSLLIVAGLFMKSVRNAENANLGFDVNHLAIFKVEPKETGRERIYEQILERLSRTAGVRAASFSDGILLGMESGTPVLIPKSVEGSIGTGTGAKAVHPDFFKTMQIPLRLGRTFNDGDRRSAKRVAVVSEAFVRKFFPAANPIGQFVRFGSRGEEQDVEIVGVAGDVRPAKNPEGPGFPMLYTSSVQDDIGNATFEVQTAGDPGKAIASIREAVHGVNPTLPVFGLMPYKLVYEWIGVGDRAIFASLTRSMGGLALLFAMIGLFSLMSYTVARRTREIGIRMAIGAQRYVVLLSVIRETLSLVAVGVAVGVGFALALSPLLESELSGLSPHDPATIAFMIALTFVVGAAAGCFPALRAAAVDPMVALRDE